MFNLRYIFLLQCSYQTAALQALGKYRTIISPRSPKDAKRENKHKQKKKKQDAMGALFLACFLPCTSRSRGKYLRRLVCLRSHVLRAYCNFESKRAISITLFGRRPIKETFVNINW